MGGAIVVGLLGLLSVDVVLSSPLGLLVFVWTKSGILQFLFWAVMHLIQRDSTCTKKSSL